MLQQYHAVSYLDETVPSEANPSATSSTSHQFTQSKEPFTEAVSTETTSTPQATQSSIPSSSSDTITVLVVSIVVLLLLAVGGVLFLVCVLRAKASRREGRKDGERNIQVIGMKRNEAYSHVEGIEMRADATKMEGCDGEREHDITEREAEINEAYGHCNGGENWKKILYSCHLTVDELLHP